MSLIARLQLILQIPGVEDAMKRHLEAAKRQIREDPKTMYDIMGAKLAREFVVNDDDGNIWLLLGNLDWLVSQQVS